MCFAYGPSLPLDKQLVISFGFVHSRLLNLIVLALESTIIPRSTFSSATFAWPVFT